MSHEEDAFNLLLASLCPASLWASAAVTEEPEIRLVEWTIKEDTAGRRYFVGTRADDGSGRVSTAVVEFDTERQRGRTESGRVYELLGPPGRSRNGEYVWSIYKVANRITERVSSTPQRSENDQP